MTKTETYRAASIGAIDKDYDAESEIPDTATNLTGETFFFGDKGDEIADYSYAIKQDSDHVVGPKVADCVLLFAFGRYAAFPVDGWITRIMQQCYGRSDLTSYEKISRAGREYFGPNAGYAQEYLFCNREAIAGRSRNRKERE